ncbi:MAG: type IV toxin-antitoxin system AbiEi family antitoxin domain-containing protein, partial [Actinomycetota bacterium]|nr:type IV toxin-antitoxin system AbiEi family antitoxin domain-containing protein [Actinomycetota bacterium]
MSNSLAALAIAQRGVFTRQQALQHYSPGQVRARLSNGCWVRVFHGVYRRSDTMADARLRTIAAGLSMRQPVVACWHTAAELHGFSVVDAQHTHIVATVGRRQRQRLIVHSAELTRHDVCSYTGVPATTAERTATDLARGLSRPDGLA